MPSTVASTPAAYSSPATNAPESSIGPRDVCHHVVLVQAVELGAELELAERPREVHVAEDAPGLLGLVRAAEQDRLRAVADELDPVEIVDQRGHHQREHAPPGERVRGGRRGRLELGVVELDPAAGGARRRGSRAPWSCCSSRTAAGGPALRSSATASAAPGIGSPETWRTPSTSSRMAAMPGESIRVTRSVSLPLDEIELRFSRSSGPGGQHAQRSETRVEALLDVEATTALTAGQKRRVIARAGPVLRAVAQDERSQWRNRELAVERLVEALREALQCRASRAADRADAPRRASGGSSRNGRAVRERSACAGHRS